HGFPQRPAAGLGDALDALGQDRVDVAQHQVGHGLGGSVGGGAKTATKRRRIRVAGRPQRAGSAPASRIPGHSPASQARVGASDTSSANWVAVKLRSVSEDMNATSTVPAKPWATLSTVIAA